MRAIASSALARTRSSAWCRHLCSACCAAGEGSSASATTAVAAACRMSRAPSIVWFWAVAWVESDMCDRRSSSIWGASPSRRASCIAAMRSGPDPERIRVCRAATISLRFTRSVRRAMGREESAPLRGSIASATPAAAICSEPTGPRARAVIAWRTESRSNLGPMGGRARVQDGRAGDARIRVEAEVRKKIQARPTRAIRRAFIRARSLGAMRNSSNMRVIPAAPPVPPVPVVGAACPLVHAIHRGAWA